MKHTKISISSFLSLLLLTILCFKHQDVFAQFIDNHILYNPYQNVYPAVGRIMGGTTVALSDSVPNASDNPAGIGNNKQIKFFFSFRSSRGNIDFDPSSHPDLKDQQWKNNPFFGTIAVAFPFRLFQHLLTVAGSFNARLPHDYQLKDNFFSAHHEYKSGLNRINFGIGSKLSPKLSIGIGWSRWFGKREINSYVEDREFDVTKAKSQYDGDLFNMGLQAHISKKFSIGSIVYLPFQLKMKNAATMPGSYSNSFVQKQNFKGGFRIGFAYKISTSLQTGLEYGYQHKFFTSSQFDQHSIRSDYTNMQSFSVGVEHNIQFKSISFPLYIMYRYATMPNQKNENSFYRDMDFNVDGSIPQFDKNAVSQKIELGGNYSWSRFTIFLVAQWKQTSKHKIFPPPFT